MYHKTVTELLTAWDAGDSIWSLELGGIGPGYEQTIQVAAVEFARVSKDLQLTGDAIKDEQSFSVSCAKRLSEIDYSLGGLSGAQYEAAKWLAWQLCFNGGPESLLARAREQGKKEDLIQVSSFWPRVGVNRD